MIQDLSQVFNSMFKFIDRIKAIIKSINLVRIDLRRIYYTSNVIDNNLCFLNHDILSDFIHGVLYYLTNYFLFKVWW